MVDSKLPDTSYAASDFAQGYGTYELLTNLNTKGINPRPEDAHTGPDRKSCISIAHNTGMVLGAAGAAVVGGGLVAATIATAPAGLIGVGAPVPLGLAIAAGTVGVSTPFIAVETDRKLFPHLYEACRATTDGLRKLKAEAAEVVNHPISSAVGVAHAAANYVGEKFVGNPAKPPTPPGP